MEHNRRTKLVTIIALVVVAFGLSIGFAVYSRNLNIQNVQASVAGNSSNFNVVFSTSSGNVLTGTVAGNACSDPGDVIIGTATLKDTTISGITVTFSRERAKVYYRFYAYNKGSIPAYLSGITFGEKTCTGAPGTNSELVEEACKDITISVSTVNKTFRQTINKITNPEELSPGKSAYVLVNMEYNPTTVVDGNFNIKFGDITLIYSSQKPSA